MSVAYEAAKTAHFGDHPLGNSILGTVESITDLEAGQMRDYFARRYSPSNIVLAFAGNAQWRQLLELAQDRCGRWQGGDATRDAKPFRGSASFRTILRADDQQQTIVGVCRRAFARKCRPLRCQSAGDDPGRPHRLAAVLESDRSRAAPTAPSSRTRTITRLARSSLS